MKYKSYVGKWSGTFLRHTAVDGRAVRRSTAPSNWLRIKVRKRTTPQSTLRRIASVLSWIMSQWLFRFLSSSIFDYVGPFPPKAQSTPATMSKQRSTLSKQPSTLLPQTATMSNDSIVKCRPFDKVETNWTCSICFDIVERIVQLVAFDNVASTLLLVWTGLYEAVRQYTLASHLPDDATRCFPRHKIA